MQCLNAKCIECCTHNGTHHNNHYDCHIAITSTQPHNCTTLGSRVTPSSWPSARRLRPLDGHGQSPALRSPHASERLTSHPGNQTPSRHRMPTQEHWTSMPLPPADLSRSAGSCRHYGDQAVACTMCGRRNRGDSTRRSPIFVDKREEQWTAESMKHMGI